MRSTLSLATFAAVFLCLTLAGCSGNGLKTSSGGASPVEKPSPGATDSSSPSNSDTSTPSASDSESSNSGSSGRHSSNPDSSDQSTPLATSSSGHGQSAARSKNHGSSARCDVDQLSVGTRVPDGAGAAGSRYLLLTFKNKASSTCFLDGHPGVSFVGKNNGTQLGRPAQRMGSTMKRVKLKPGSTTTALLRISNAGNYDAKKCAPTTADGFRVYPPDSRVSVFVPYKVQACQRSLESGPQMSVSIVGHSG